MQWQRFLPKPSAKVIQIYRIKSGVGHWSVQTQVLVQQRKKPEINSWRQISGRLIPMISSTTTTTSKQTLPLQDHQDNLVQQTTRLARQLSKLPSKSTSLQTLRRSPESISKTNVRRESPKWSQIWPAMNRLRHPLRQNWTTTEQHMLRGSLTKMAWQVPAQSNQTTTSPRIEHGRMQRKSSDFLCSTLYHLNQLPRYNRNGTPCGQLRHNIGIVRWTTTLAAV